MSIVGIVLRGAKVTGKEVDMPYPLKYEASLPDEFHSLLC